SSHLGDVDRFAPLFGCSIVEEVGGKRKLRDFGEQRFVAGLIDLPDLLLIGRDEKLAGESEAARILEASDERRDDGGREIDLTDFSVEHAEVARWSLDGDIEFAAPSLNDALGAGADRDRSNLRLGSRGEDGERRCEEKCLRHHARVSVLATPDWTANRPG